MSGNDTNAQLVRAVEQSDAAAVRAALASGADAKHVYEVDDEGVGSKTAVSTFVSALAFSRDGALLAAATQCKWPSTLLFAARARPAC